MVKVFKPNQVSHSLPIREDTFFCKTLYGTGSAHVLGQGLRISPKPLPFRNQNRYFAAIAAALTQRSDFPLPLPPLADRQLLQRSP